MKNDQKATLLNLINGYKEAEKKIREEKRIWLAKLSERESLRQYDLLCRLWEGMAKNKDIKRLKKQRLLFLIKRRQLLNKAGKYVKRR